MKEMKEELDVVGLNAIKNEEGKYL